MILIVQVIIGPVIAEPNITENSYRWSPYSSTHMPLFCFLLHFMKLFKAVNVWANITLFALFLTLRIQTVQCL